jgi:ribosomal protein L24E
MNNFFLQTWKYRRKVYRNRLTDNFKARKKPDYLKWMKKELKVNKKHQQAEENIKEKAK